MRHPLRDERRKGLFSAGRPGLAFTMLLRQGFRILLLLAMLIPSIGNGLARASTTGVAMSEQSEAAPAAAEECCPTNCACDCPCSCSRSARGPSVTTGTRVQHLERIVQAFAAVPSYPLEVYLDLNPQPPRA